MNNSSCILLVDDDPASNFINKLLFDFFEYTGQLLFASNGEEAIDVLQNYHQENHRLPNLILLDLNMPIVDGFEFLETFEKLELSNKKGAAIVVLTTSLNPKDVERAMKLGISDFISKPLKPEALQRILEKHFCLAQ